MGMEFGCFEVPDSVYLSTPPVPDFMIPSQQKFHVHGFCGMTFLRLSRAQASTSNNHPQPTPEIASKPTSKPFEKATQILSFLL